MEKTTSTETRLCEVHGAVTLSTGFCGLFP